MRSGELQTLRDAARQFAAERDWKRFQSGFISLSLAISLLASSLSHAAVPSGEPSVTSRLASCDASIVLEAVEELLKDPKTLKEPIVLFNAAAGARSAGRAEEAAFLFLAAKLRTSRQLLFVKREPQVLSIMLMSVGPLVLPTLESDPALARRVVKRVIDWDRVTPDPFLQREEAKSSEIAKELAAIDEGLARTPELLSKDPARLAQARQAVAQVEHEIKRSRAEGCGSGTLDPADVEVFTQRIKSAAETFVRTHPFVIGNSRIPIRHVTVTSYRTKERGLPSRLNMIVWLEGRNNKFYAEVDVLSTITPERKVGSVKLSLACISDLSMSERGVFSKDVCADDPDALKPNTGTAALDLEIK